MRAGAAGAYAWRGFRGSGWVLATRFAVAPSSTSARALPIAIAPFEFADGGIGISATAPARTLAQLAPRGGAGARPVAKDQDSIKVHWQGRGTAVCMAAAPPCAWPRCNGDAYVAPARIFGCRF